MIIYRKTALDWLPKRYWTIVELYCYFSLSAYPAVRNQAHQVLIVPAQKH